MLPFETELRAACSRLLGFPIFIYPYLELAQISLFALLVYVHTPPRADDLFRLSQAWVSVLLEIKLISWLRAGGLHTPLSNPPQWSLAFSTRILNYSRAKVFSEQYKFLDILLRLGLGPQGLLKFKFQVGIILVIVSL